MPSASLKEVWRLLLLEGMAGQKVELVAEKGLVVGEKLEEKLGVGAQEVLVARRKGLETEPGGSSSALCSRRTCKRGAMMGGGVVRSSARSFGRKRESGLSSSGQGGY